MQEEAEGAWKNRILLVCLAVEVMGPDPSLRSRVKGRVAKETSYVKEKLLVGIRKKSPPESDWILAQGLGEILEPSSFEL